MFLYELHKPVSWFRSRSLSSLNIRAKDRRAIIRALYGDWFAQNSLKLGRDYLVSLSPSITKEWYPALDSSVKISISIKDRDKFLMFKLTWCGLV